MLIRYPIIDPLTQTYKGPLSEYQYNSPEFGDLLTFLQECKNKKNIYIIDSTDLKEDLPPNGYDTYIIGCFGELATVNFLKKINDSFSSKKLVCITSQQIDCAEAIGNFKIFYIEHLHKLAKYFPKQMFKSLDQRNYYHSILTRRIEPHRYLFTAALLMRYPETEYSLVRLFEERNFNYQKFVQELLDRFNYHIHDIKLIDEIKFLLSQPPKILPGNQWSLNNAAYEDSKLHWTNESIFLSLSHEPRAYLTEKTIKPIVSKTPFVILGQTGVYKRLKNLNFNLYTEIIDINFDQGNDEKERINLIFHLMDKLTPEFLDDNLKTFQNIADYNFDYYYSGFEETCDRINELVFDKILQYLDE